MIVNLDKFQYMNVNNSEQHARNLFRKGIEKPVATSGLSPVATSGQSVLLIFKKKIKIFERKIDFHSMMKFQSHKTQILRPKFYFFCLEIFPSLILGFREILRKLKKETKKD